MDYYVIDKIIKDSRRHISHFMKQRDSLEESQLLLFDGLRIFDRLFIDLHTGNPDGESYERMSDTIEHGYPAFLKEAFCDFTSVQNAFTHPLTEDGVEIVEGIIYSCGLLGRSLDLRELISKEVVKVQKNGKKLIQLAYKEQYSHVDAMEQFFVTLYAEMVHAFQSKKCDTMLAQQKEISDKMRALVYVWKDHYIGYTVTQEIDDYFLTNAELDTNEAVEWRAFPNECTFGGVKYEVYVNTIMYFMSFAIKHMQYCFLLKETNPHLIFENLPTIIMPIEYIIELIMDINSISSEDAHKVFNAITLNTQNFSLHTQIRSAAPPLIRISDNECLRSACGCMDRPYEFLLDNLKYMFPKEWDANTFLREAEFREELYAFFDPDRYISLHRNIEIKQNGKTLTDIDACLIDKEAGTIGLFQLKWQDLGYANNSYNLSKKRNFKEKTSQWISTLRKWIASVSERQIADYFGVSPKLVDKAKIKLFVLGRHNCNFADSVPPDPMVAWGQWYQVVVLLTRITNRSCSIEFLFNILQEENPFNRKIVHTQKKYKIGDLTIATEGIQSPYLIFRRQ